MSKVELELCSMRTVCDAPKWKKKICLHWPHWTTVFVCVQVFELSHGYLCTSHAPVFHFMCNSLLLSVNWSIREVRARRLRLWTFGAADRKCMIDCVCLPRLDDRCLLPWLPWLPWPPWPKLNRIFPNNNLPNGSVSIKTLHCGGRWSCDRILDTCRGYHRAWWQINTIHASVYQSIVFVILDAISICLYSIETIQLASHLVPTTIAAMCCHPISSDCWSVQPTDEQLCAQMKHHSVCVWPVEMLSIRVLLVHILRSFRTINFPLHRSIVIIGIFVSFLFVRISLPSLTACVCISIRRYVHIAQHKKKHKIDQRIFPIQIGRSYTHTKPSIQNTLLDHLEPFMIFHLSLRAWWVRCGGHGRTTAWNCYVLRECYCCCRFFFFFVIVVVVDIFVGWLVLYVFRFSLIRFFCCVRLVWSSEDIRRSNISYPPACRPTTTARAIHTNDNVEAACATIARFIVFFLLLLVLRTVFCECVLYIIKSMPMLSIL